MTHTFNLIFEIALYKLHFSKVKNKSIVYNLDPPSTLRG